MTSLLPRFSTDELWSALEDVDPVASLTERVICGDVTWTPTRRPSAEEAGGVTDPDKNVARLVPVSSLHLFQRALIVTTAAQALLAPGLVTAAILGSELAAQVQLGFIGRYLTGISHVALLVQADGQIPVEPRVRHQLDLAGIGLSFATNASDAVRGANLVIVPEGAREDLEVGHLAAGSVVINASDSDLPKAVFERADQIYVDHSTLIKDSPHRYVVQMHNGARIHWACPAASGLTPKQITADLGAVLTGRHSGRRSYDDVLLVELLDKNPFDPALESHLYQAATARRLMCPSPRAHR